jgi:hypothetical protein
VKYAQCVKIWPFDILVLFLIPCVQFSEALCSVSDGHCIESGNFQFLMKKKGDMLLLCPSLIIRKGRSSCVTSRISVKGSRVIWGHVSLLFNYIKKDCQ